MGIQGPIILRSFRSTTSIPPIAPTPESVIGGSELGEVLSCLRTGRIWITGKDSTGSATYRQISGSDSRVFTHNSTGSTLSKGQVVYVTGSNGTDKITVALANAGSEATSAKTIGLVWENIENGSDGFVVTDGFFDGIETNSIGSAGDAVWLSTTDGTMTTTRPTQPNHGVFLGWIVKSAGAGAGSIYVKVNNYQELEELHDVLVTSPANSDILVYDQSNSLWKNKKGQDLATRVVLESEMNAAGNLTALQTGTGAATTYGIQGDSTYQTIAAHNTGTTAAGRAAIGTSGTTNVVLGQGAVEFRAIVRPTALSTNAQTYIYRAGIFDNLDGGVVDGVMFEYTDSVTPTSTPNWMTHSISNSVTIGGTDTGVAVSTTTWSRLRITVNASGTEAKFYINDVLVDTKTTNIPTGSPRASGFYSCLRKTNGTTSSFVYVDYLGLSMEVVR